MPQGFARRSHSKYATGRGSGTGTYHSSSFRAMAANARMQSLGQVVGSGPRSRMSRSIFTSALFVIAGRRTLSARSKLVACSVPHPQLLPSALDMFTDHAKKNGPYRDRPGHPKTQRLRKSIAWFIVARKSAGGIVQTGGRDGVIVPVRRSGLRVNKGTVMGVVAAGATYAKFVEWKPGYWVLGGSLRALGKKISATIGTAYKTRAKIIARQHGGVYRLEATKEYMTRDYLGEAAARMRP